jgi:uncharacterized repeat protein (TIGR03803 family)
MRLTATNVVALALSMAAPAVAQNPAYKILYRFGNGEDGAVPYAGVILDKAGLLYGSTFGGGSGGLGTVFKLAPAEDASRMYTLLLSFDGSNGANPGADLVFGSNGALYGTTEAGGTSNTGTVFELAPPQTTGGAWSETVLFSFPVEPFYQNTPMCSLLIGPGGSVFGTTSDSPGGGGSVFALEAPTAPNGAWTRHTLLNLWKESIGGNPLAGVVAIGGSLYGTASTSPYSGCGSVFEATPSPTPGTSWSGTAIHTFNVSDGCSPTSTLTQGPGRVLFGTTLAGGSGLACTSETGPPGCGTVFQLTPPAVPGEPWAESVLYSFTGIDGDGAYPRSAVVLGPHGFLYGSTLSGGVAPPGSNCSILGVESGCGTLFQLAPPTLPGGAWTETILHRFTGLNGDGAAPLGNLVMNSSGVLYGTTEAGGVGWGTIFAFMP